MPASIFKIFRGFLKLGYSPIARFENSWPKAWSDFCQTPASLETLQRWSRAPNVGFALACGYSGLINGKPVEGRLIAIDCDTSEKAILAAVLKALPECRIARFGSKGFALLARYNGSGDCRFHHIYTGEGAAKRPLIEIKGLGQNITVPPSIHAKTGEAYQWWTILAEDSVEVMDAPPAFDELPLIGDDDIDRLRKAMEPWASKPRPTPEKRANFNPHKIPKSRYEAWYLAGLRNAQSELSGARDGRPTMLFKRVCALGAGVHHGFIPRMVFEAAFLDACDVNGLASRDGRHACLATISSGLRLAEDDELPDLGAAQIRKSTAGKSARNSRNKPNGSGGTGDPTGCHDSGGGQQKRIEDQRGNGLDHDAAVDGDGDGDGDVDVEDSDTEDTDTRTPIVLHGGSLSENASAAEVVLFEAKAPIYHQAGALVTPTRCSLRDNKGEVVHVPAISQITSVGIRDAIAKYARWQKYDGRAKRFVDVNPPADVASTIVDRKGQGKNWRILAGVTSSPLLRYDGTLATREGYDEISGWYLQDLPRMSPLPPHPDEADARASFEILKPLLDEFPFIDSQYPERAREDTASYSVAMSSLLTLPARAMMNVVPGHAATANEAGTGKTYLFNISAAIGLGAKCPIITIGETKEETEKRLGSLMIQGSQILCLDNIEGDLQGSFLAQLISEDEVQARILQKSKVVKMTNRFVVFATGNNLQILGDLNRRLLICEMDAALEHPYERHFDHDPVEMVLRDRGKYLAACLTIIRAHHLACYPGSAELEPLNSFNRWTQIVRGALVWLGLRDPVESMETLKKSDSQRLEQGDFVRAMAQLYEPGYAKHRTIHEIVEESNRSIEDGKGEARRTIIQTLKEHCSNRFGEISSQRASKWIKRFLNRRFGDLRLCSKKEDTRPMAEYWVDRLP